MTIDRDPHGHRPPHRARAADHRRRDGRGLVPPPQFADATFDTYRADAAYPSQQEAKDLLIAFSGGGAPAEARRAASAAPKKRPELKPGVYLDGGFGVGKTHLLAAVYHAMPARRKYFGSFIEYTALVGALGYQNTVELLPRLRPALHRRVRARRSGRHDGDDAAARASSSPSGTRLAATSNTPPNALGEGRFAAQDFLREIHAMSASFQTIRIDGNDYRHRAVDGHAEVLEPTRLRGGDRGCRDDGTRLGRRVRRRSSRTSRACTRRGTSGSSRGSSVVGLRDVAAADRPVRGAALRRLHRPRLRRRSCRSARRGSRSIWSSPTRCWPAATARSTCARSRAWSRRHSPDPRVDSRRDSRRALGARNTMFTRAGLT